MWIFLSMGSPADPTFFSRALSRPSRILAPANAIVRFLGVQGNQLLFDQDVKSSARRSMSWAQLASVPHSAASAMTRRSERPYISISHSRMPSCDRRASGARSGRDGGRPPGRPDAAFRQDRRRSAGKLATLDPVRIELTRICLASLWFDRSEKLEMPEKRNAAALGFRTVEGFVNFINDHGSDGFAAMGLRQQIVRQCGRSDFG